MSYRDHHPDDETLRLYAVGKLTETQGDEIEAHLAGCEPCSRRLDEIERKKSDPFLREMKAAESEPSGDFTSDTPLFDKRYRLEKLLGRGGMGEAWKAFDETAKRYVVLKFVPKDIQNVNEAMGAVLDSFGRVEKLQHQHICPLYSLDNDPEHGFFLVMKYIDGLPLDAYYRRYAGIHGPIPFDKIIRILRDVANALDYAHSRKVIHRDVKPANIMVGETDGVQLIDFGLADEIRASLTRTVDVSITENTAKISGTRSYMAPEQWEGRKQDARTDQYALAVTAYELLSGHVPFSGTDTEVLKNAVLNDLPSPIPDRPDYVNTALFKGLAKNRNDRFENCRAFVEALAKESEPPRLPPPLPSAMQPTAWKWFTPALIVSVLFLTVLAFFLIRQSPKPTVDADLNTKSVAETDHIAGNAPQIDFEKGLDKADTMPGIPPNSPKIEGFEAVVTKGQATAPFFHPQRNNELFRVVRVTIELDAKAVGRMIVKRGLSAEPLPAFRGMVFDSNSFRDARLYHGQNGLGRIVFPKGDTSLKQTSENLSLHKTKPFGWQYWISGNSHDNRYGGLTRFELRGKDNRAGVSLGKTGCLPCAITFEVVDNDDYLPYLEIVLYEDFEKEVKSCTISCWGVKDENGRLRINAAYSHPFMEKERTFIVEDTPIKKNMTFSNVFQLPPVAVGSVNMVKFGLYAQHQATKWANRSGFDLTFLDIVGRFKGDAGFTIDERGSTPIVGKVDPHGPAWGLQPGAEVLSINDQSGSASKLRETLNTLQFGDTVTVRIVPMGSGGSVTSLFCAE